MAAMAVRGFTAAGGHLSAAGRLEWAKWAGRARQGASHVTIVVHVIGSQGCRGKAVGFWEDKAGEQDGAPHGGQRDSGGEAKARQVAG